MRRCASRWATIITMPSNPKRRSQCSRPWLKIFLTASNFEKNWREFTERWAGRKKSSETLAGIVEIDPQNAEIHRELGSHYLNKEDYKSASEHFRQAMRLTTGTGR